MGLKETSKFISLIRANQGHSIPVDVELEEKTPPAVLYHGTGEKYGINRRHGPNPEEPAVRPSVL